MLNTIQHQTKGKQAYNLLKKYEKEESDNTDYLKTINDKEKSPTPPIQVRFFDTKTIFQTFPFFFSLK
jgi:hypothetical protein